MRAKLTHTLIVVSAAFALSTLGLRAQDGEGEAEETAPAAAEGSVTQGEVAIILAQRLGLSPTLSTSPSGTEAAAALLAQGIAPFDGWQLDQVLTVGDFARIIALSLGLDVDPEKADDPQAYVDAVKAENISLDDADDASGNLNTVAGTGPGVNSELTSSDPLVSRQVFGEPDERATGADTSAPAFNDNVDLPATPVSPAVVAQVIAQTGRSGSSASVAPVTPN